MAAFSPRSSKIPGCSSGLIHQLLRLQASQRLLTQHGKRHLLMHLGPEFLHDCLMSGAKRQQLCIEPSDQAILLFDSGVKLILGLCQSFFHTFVHSDVAA
jgi:hypothetical protein